MTMMSFYAGRVWHCQGLHNAFNAKRLLADSNVVAKVKVISGTGYDSILEDFINYYFKTKVAVVQTLNPIKGEVPEKFVIKYPKEYPRDCSHLRKGSIAIVFLKKDADGYRFLERLNEQILLETETTTFDFGNSPEDKMLAKVLEWAKTTRGDRQLTAIDELGNLKDIRAAAELRLLSQSVDFFVRGRALASRIKINDVPELQELSEYLNILQKLRISPGENLNYGDLSYPSASVITVILDALDKSIEIDGQRPPTVINKLEGFEYVKFIDQVMNLEIVKKDEWSGRIISSILEKLADPQSVPILKVLLGHPAFDARFNTVIALTKIFNDPLFEKEKTTPYYSFRTHEKEYIFYWQNKLDAINENQ